MPAKTTNYDFNLPIVADPVDADLWGAQLNANWTALDTDLKAVSDVANASVGITPVGLVSPYAGETAPSKWVLCQGQAISRTTYSDLFTAIGTTYGVGDGSTTFNVPDLGGRVVAGKESSATRLTSGVSGVDGATLGAAGGNQNMHQHTHTATVTDPGHVHTTVAGQVGFSASGGSTQFVQGTTNTGSATTGISVSIANAGTGNSQNVQPTIVLNYIIYAGV